MSIFEIQTPQESVGFQFWKLHQQWYKRVTAVLTPYAITHTQFVMMASIAWFEEQGTKLSRPKGLSLDGSCFGTGCYFIFFGCPFAIMPMNKITCTGFEGFSFTPIFVDINAIRLVFAEWREGFVDTMRFTPPSLKFDRIVLNDSNALPEFNFRDNTLKYTKKWYRPLDKPLQFKLMTDIENPHYSQVFVNPYGEWNAYDGVVLGAAFYNKSLIRRPFNYNISPTYAFRAKSLTGSGSVGYTYYFRDSDIFHSASVAMFMKYSHYDKELAYFKYNPAVRLYFKRHNPRGVDNNYLFMRYVSVEKEIPNFDGPIDDIAKYEEYKIFNIRHIYENPEIIDDFRYKTDLQIGDKFGKISSEIRFRKLTDWHNRIDVRLFAGIFLYNNVGNTYYDFGINSSTDYLFDYNFLGRSETSGILSQQIIVNDGAFKTKYNTFANNWLVASNLHVSIWKFFEVYGDVGMYSNKGDSNKFIWDTGVRFNFVPEIFEFYFPIYSNKGSEFAEPNYQERIRFVFTADFGEIIDYFRRGLF